LQVVVALVMIGLILVQHGKGADAGAAFGSGASGTVFGAQGSANFLSRATAALATVFIVLSLALAYMINGQTITSGGSVTDQLQQPAQTLQVPQESSQAGAADTPADQSATQQNAGNSTAPGTVADNEGAEQSHDQGENQDDNQ